MKKAILSMGAILICGIAFAYNDNELSLGTDGKIRYNTDTAALEYSNNAGVDWLAIGSGGGGGGSTIKVDGVTKTSVDLVDGSDITVAISGEDTTFSLASGVASNIGLGVAAYGWGDHGAAGYLKTESDTLSTVLTRGNAAINSITLGNASPAFARLSILGDGVTARLPDSFTATNQMLSQTIAVQGNGGTYFYAEDVNADLEVALGASLNGNAFIGSVSADNLEIRTNNTSRIFVASSGNVAIGTTVPTSALSVNGTASMSGFKLGTSTTAGYVLTADSGGVGTWQAQGTSSQWTTSGNNIYYTTGNVGIGSTAPTTALDIGSGALKTSSYVKSPSDIHITVPYPSSSYAMSTVLPLMGNVGSAFTVDSISVNLNADPTTEINANLKYADSCIGFANATVINDLDTTAGTRYDNSITSGAVASGKCVYIEWDAAPDSSTTFMVVDIKKSNT